MFVELAQHRRSPLKTLTPSPLAKGAAGSLFAVTFLLLGSNPAQAVPVLQLYVEGATYDGTETWTETGPNPCRLWVIGNVAGPGGKGVLNNVRLSAVYDTTSNP